MAATLKSPNSPIRNGRSPRQIIEFHLLLPLGIGLFLGAARIGAQQFETIAHHMAYTALFSVLSWVCYGFGAKLMSWVLRPWHPPLLVVLLTGYFVGGFGLWWPFRDVLNSFFLSTLIPGSAFGSFWPPPAEGMAGYIAFTAQGLGWWLLANWLDFRFRRVQRFGFVPPAVSLPPASDEPVPSPDASSVTSSPASEPRLSNRLPANLRGADIYALEAEEHYTKIHTNKGNAMLLMRFSDAIAEMDPQPGLQVHRSFWVSKSAVERVARVDQRWMIRLHGGLDIPVSRSYRVIVQTSGLLGGNTMGDD